MSNYVDMAGNQSAAFDPEKLPTVSILTPVYDRRKFLPLMLLNVKLFQYPKKKLEWVICDSLSKDGASGEKLFMDDAERKECEKITGVKITFIYKNETMSIGKKRNFLAKQASHTYLANMDSDDIYFPSYILYSIQGLLDHKKQCCGSPEMLFVYPHKEYKVTAIRCEAMRQIHEATMVMTKKHFKRMGGYQCNSQGEGAKIVDGCNSTLFIKTECDKCMMCVCHSGNTIDKEQFYSDERVMDQVDVSKIPHIEILKDIMK